MATIQELTDENIALKTQIADLQLKNARLKDVEVSVQGIVHHVETHGSTQEDLLGAIALFKVKRSLANVNPVPVEEIE